MLANELAEEILDDTDEVKMGGFFDMIVKGINLVNLPGKRTEDFVNSVGKDAGRFAKPEEVETLECCWGSFLISKLSSSLDTRLIISGCLFLI